MFDIAATPLNATEMVFNNVELHIKLFEGTSSEEAQKSILTFTLWKTEVK